jgi:methyl-accepting chemotaxis protein
VSKVKEGSELVGKTAEVFSQVAASTGKVKELVAEIAAASSEQAQGVDQINKAVNEMNTVTQQTAANAEECGSASEELNAQAEQMKGFVVELTDMVGSNNGAGAGNGLPGRLADWRGTLRPSGKRLLAQPHRPARTNGFPWTMQQGSRA